MSEPLRVDLDRPGATDTDDGTGATEKTASPGPPPHPLF